MSKVEVSIVAETLKKHRDITPTTLREIIEELNEIIQPADDDVKPPKAKQQYVALIADATGAIKTDLTGWVVQIPEDASPASLLDRVMAAAHDFNSSKKGRLLPVKTVGEAFESAGRKWFKNQGVAVKTKLPIYFLRTTNQLIEAPTA